MSGAWKPQRFKPYPTEQASHILMQEDDKYWKTAEEDALPASAANNQKLGNPSPPRSIPKLFLVFLKL